MLTIVLVGSKLITYVTNASGIINQTLARTQRDGDEIPSSFMRLAQQMCADMEANSNGEDDATVDLSHSNLLVPTTPVCWY